MLGLNQFCKNNTAISRKAVGKMSMRQSRKIIRDMINTLLLTTVAVEPTCFASISTREQMSVASLPLFHISLENRADKTTKNTFRDCRVHFFRQPLTKQLYLDT